MRRARKILVILAGVFALWVVVVFILGFVFADRTATEVTDRIGHSLQATGGFADSDLALVRGRLRIDKLSLGRDDVTGKLSLAVGEIDCDLLPLGLAAIDRDCRELSVRGVRLELSTLALFKIQRPKKKPMYAAAFTLHDAELVFSPTALAPSLGKVRVVIHDATAGPTHFKTPVSWLFSLETLHASLEVSGMRFEVTYANRMATIGGGVLGSKPVTLPVKLPVADLADDAKAELAKLAAFGKELAKSAVAQRATDWLKGL